MYVANTGNHTVSQVLNVGGTPTVVPSYAAGFNGPAGVALEP
jgi:DNA-binding beta-propeller fold protein YncE